jgi:hypothetical protein
LKPEPVDEVVLGLSAFRKTQDTRERQRRKPDQHEFEVRLIKQKIENGQSHEDQKQIRHFKTADDHFLI